MICFLFLFTVQNHFFTLTTAGILTRTLSLINPSLDPCAINWLHTISFFLFSCFQILLLTKLKLIIKGTQIQSNMYLYAISLIYNRKFRKKIPLNKPEKKKKATILIWKNTVYQTTLKYK